MKGLFVSIYLLLSFSQPWEGKTVAVLDGDTIEVLKEGKAIRIRLAGIDCPEKQQDFGQAAKRFCSALTFGKTVKVISTGIDRYGRTIADVYVDEVWVNKKLVEEGLAWHYKKYSSSEELAEAETKARDEKIGLWKRKTEKRIAPWDFRKTEK